MKKRTSSLSAGESAKGDHLATGSRQVCGAMGIRQRGNELFILSKEEGKIKGLKGGEGTKSELRHQSSRSERGARRSHAGSSPEREFYGRIPQVVAGALV